MRRFLPLFDIAQKVFGQQRLADVEDALQRSL
jgi:hypothetical protein